jgi:SHS2 domain-containing protein
LTQATSGYRDIEHTADWELEVWAPDLPSLLEQAARGMYALMGAELKNEPHRARDIELSAIDAESLLVAFLSELLYLAEKESLGFDSYKLDVQGLSLHAKLGGAPLASLGKEIKAVTYHDLAVRPTANGLVVHIVFDI